MRKGYILTALLLFTLNLFLPINSYGGSGKSIAEQQANALLAAKQIGFIENMGQLRGPDKKPVHGVLFNSHINNSDVCITESGITYIFMKQEEEKSGKDDEPIPVEWCRVDMLLKGATIRKENVVSEEPIEQGYNNYYFPFCPKGILGVRTYGKITVKNIYPGIDWILYNRPEGLKYDFIVHPGANPADIKIEYKGSDEMKTDSNGTKLVIKTKLGQITEGALHCYQGNNSIQSQYILSSHELGFKLGQYNSTSDLTIDPPIELLQWGTYLGADAHIGPRAICTDAAGNIYITGYTDCASMILLDPGGGAYYQSFSNAVFAGGNTAFIMKFNSAGTLLWSTYYGGSGYDWATSIVTDAKGNLFVGGYTGSGDLPTMNPGGGAYYQSALSGGGDFDLFLCKFNATGALTWGTYYGGSLDDRARGIDIDAGGNLWVTGYTTSSDFPTLNGGGGSYCQGTFGGGVNTGDAFVLKFDNNGKQLLGTYYGGSDDEDGYSIKTAPSGDIFFTGYTHSTNFPTLNPGGGAYYQAANAGGNDLFMSKLSSTGIQLWSTYYGGSADDWSSNEPHNYGNLGIDFAGNVYVTGTSLSTNFPTLNPGSGAYYQAANAGGRDAVILKFRTSGVPVWATYYGGGSAEEGNAIVTDANGNIFLTGQSVSGTIPTLNPGGGAYYQKNNAAAMDIFLDEFDSTGVMFWGTFFGGNQDDWSTAAALMPSGCLLVTGEWISTGGITTQDPGGGAYYQSVFSGLHDGFVLEFCPVCTTPTITIAPSSPSVCSGDSVALTASGAGAYKWAPAATLSDSVGTTVYAKPGTATTYTVTGTEGTCSGTQTITVSVNPSPTVTVVPPSATLCGGGSVGITASGATTYSWSPSAGLTCSTCANPTANPTVTTTYTVAGTSGGCTDSVKVVITVNSPPTVSVVPSSPTVCRGDSVALTASGASTYSWAPSAGLSCTACPNPKASPATTSTYTVIGSNGGCNDTVNVVVTVNPSPTVSVVPSSATICPGTSVGLTASGATGYTWTPAAGLNSTTGANVTANPTVTTTYTVVGTSGGCTDSVKVMITVNPTPTVTVTPSLASICSGDSVVLTATGAISYTWMPSGGLSCTTCANPTAKPGSTTTYSVVGTSGGCTDTVPVTITVNPLPVISVTPALPSICAGSNVLLTASGASTYTWKPSATLSSSTGPSVTASPPSSTTYNVVGTSAVGCKDSTTVTVTVNPLPAATAASSVTIIMGDSTTLTASGGGTYIWSPATGLNCATCATVIATPTATTEYCVLVTNAKGCSDSACVLVTVELNCGDLYVPTAFSPNGDKENDMLFVYGNCIKALDFVIYDRWGNKVFETTDPKQGWDGKYKGELMNSGVFVYYLNVTTVTNEYKTLKGNITLVR